MFKGHHEERVFMVVPGHLILYSDHSGHLEGLYMVLTKWATLLLSCGIFKYSHHVFGIVLVLRNLRFMHFALIVVMQHRCLYKNDPACF